MHVLNVSIFIFEHIIVYGLLVFDYFVCQKLLSANENFVTFLNKTLIAFEMFVYREMVSDI